MSPHIVEWLVSPTFHVRASYDECNQIPDIGPHWLLFYLGIVEHQAGTWCKVGQVSQHYMASLEVNKWINFVCSMYQFECSSPRHQNPTPGTTTRYQHCSQVLKFPRKCLLLPLPAWKLMVMGITYGVQYRNLVLVLRIPYMMLQRMPVHSVLCQIYDSSFPKLDGWGRMWTECVALYVIGDTCTILSQCQAGRYSYYAVNVVQWVNIAKLGIQCVCNEGWYLFPGTKLLHRETWPTTSLSLSV